MLWLLPLLYLDEPEPLPLFEWTTGPPWLLSSAMGGNTGDMELILNGGVVIGVSTLNSRPWSKFVAKLLRALVVPELGVITLGERPFTEPGPLPDLLATVRVLP